MSDQPYLQPGTPGYPPNFDSPPSRPGMAPRPGVVTFIIICCCILGAIGFLCNVVGIGNLFFADALVSMQDGANPPTEEMLQAREDLKALSKPWFVPNVIIMGLNFLIAPFLLFTSLFALKPLTGSRKLFSLAILSALLFCVVRAAIQFAFQFGNSEKLLDVQKRMLGPQGNEMGGMMDIINNATFAFLVVMSVGLIGFYVFSLFKMNGERAKQWYGG